MKSVNKKAPNCISQPAECVQWNSGNISYLGVCDGDFLPEIIWEIVNKLQAIAGEDLSTFDIDSLLDICNAKAPLEVNLLSILTLLRDNEVCLKDYIDILEQKINDLSTASNITVDTKCLDVDNIYNLGITQEQLNQLIVDEICADRARIVNLETAVSTLSTDVNDLKNAPPVAAVEPTFATCVDGGVKKTSDQVKSIANELCDYRDNYVGTKQEITTAIAQTPAKWTSVTFQNQIIAKYGTNKWDLHPYTLADNYNNLLLAYGLLEEQVAGILATCCAPTCDKVKIGFSVILGDNPNDFIIRFRATDGTSIPAGFTDVGSTITFTDVNGVTYGPLPINVTEEESESYNLNGMTLSKPVFITINSKVSNGSLYCEKCVGKSVNLNDAACPVCEVVASGTGSVTIVYQVN